MVQPRSTSSTSARASRRTDLLILAALLALVLGFLFSRSFVSGQALFANDGPLALQHADPYKLPDAFFGIWNTLYWLGADNGYFVPNQTALLLWFLGPTGYVNFAVPIACLIAGLSAAYFFRKLGFAGWVCVLGGIAAALNGNFFSNGCWGLPSRSLCLAMTFLALAALQSSLAGRTWLKVVLAGLAVGMSISDGGDNGAFFSLFVAAYAVVISVYCELGSPARRGFRGVARVAITAVFAAILAAGTLKYFGDIAVKGVVGAQPAQQDTQTKEQKWLGATLWSLPKAETLRVIIPGLYGYRMDTPEGGNYWGGVGAQPGIPQSRYSGAGEYAGVIVALIAAWALAQAFSKKNSVFSDTERRMILFWTCAAIVALLLAWGRFAPFYRLMYALPYFSTIRNPMKLMHPFHMSLIILFAYGLQGLGRRYLTGDKASNAAGESFIAQGKRWWKNAQPFERLWTWGCIGFLALSVLAFVIYSGLHSDLVRHLTSAGFSSTEMANSIARFSSHEVGIYVLVLIVSVAALVAIQTGFFRGKRGVWAAIIIGVILVADLARANMPWIQYYNYRERLATNPVMDLLRKEPHLQRVTAVSLNAQGQGEQMQQGLQQVYRVEWLQHHFQYYNIQALDVAQMPRVPEDYAAFTQGLGRNPLRMWQLTNTRYLLGLAPAADVLNQQLDPANRRFSARTLFTFAQNGDFYTAIATTNGPFAVIEYAGALPRAGLYSAWQTQTNDTAALSTLADPAFDPTKQVVLAEPVEQAAAPSGNTGSNSVQIVRYSPLHVSIKASAGAPSVLLLNDRYHPAWQVAVDNKPAKLLRANFIARGVAVPAGEHVIDFRFKPSLFGFWITTSAVVFGILLCVLLWLLARRPSAPSA